MESKQIIHQRTVGIIAEYNPFHNGHLYLLQEAKRLSGAAFTVVVMSGSFVQRGTPAFIDKMTRTKMALENGADLVVELPVRYATGSAEFFSLGAVSLLHNLGVIDSICFGSECGNISALQNIADYIHKDCDDFNNAVASYTSKGLSYPSACEKALLQHADMEDKELLKEIVSSPNNILGLEYMKALAYCNSSITPYTIKRKQTGYHDPSLEVSTENEISIHSATAIRSVLEQEASLSDIKMSVPSSVYTLLNHKTGYPVTSSMLSDMLFYAISTASIEELAACQDMNTDLARTIKNSLNQFENFDQFIYVLKSKQYTYTRISRCLLHILLKIQNYTLKGQSPLVITPYARILGLKRNASPLLKEIKQNGNIPMITKMADAKDVLDSSALHMLSEDIFATDLYHRLVYQAFHIKEKNDIQTSPVIL